jgi:hypothetical protein
MHFVVVAIGGYFFVILGYIMIIGGHFIINYFLDILNCIIISY